MLIGICGKSGSGKSTISNIIKDYFDNTVIIDIDKIGHESYNDDQVINNMILYISRWGEHFGDKDGSIAQLGEHLPYKQRVTGSSPVVPTIWPGSSAG